MRRRHLMPFGAEITGEGVRFVLWAPDAASVNLVTGDRDIPMRPAGQGWFKWTCPAAKPGDLYAFATSTADGLVPDPASRFQPADDERHSQIIDPRSFVWSDQAWSGRPWSEAVIAEIHVGTATRDGTFAALKAQLGHYAATGFTAIQLMPVAQTPGRRTWGYDGILPFAPNNAYGTPDDLKGLIDAAHALDLMVLLDVVYNHFGPSGNFLPLYAKNFFTGRHHTPWGAAMNFDGDTASEAVREFFIQNALYWLEEYHFDGLRFDAVNEMIDRGHRHVLDEIAERVRSALPYRAIHLILENANNEASRLTRGGDGEALAYDAQWNDDLHHCWHRLLTGENDGYYNDYGGDTITRLGQCLAGGFCYQGEYSRYFERHRGEKTGGLPPQAFVAFLQNHDQTGNRARGERLTALTSPNHLALARALLLLSPQIPMLFMGEEWGAATPFLYFVDFANDPGLERNIREGRAKEAAAFTGKAGGEPLPDPSAPDTFERSKLDWSQTDKPPCSAIWNDTRHLLALRRDVITPLIKSGFIEADFVRTGPGGLTVTWRFDDGSLRFAVNFGATPLRVETNARETILWHSQEKQSHFEKSGRMITLGAWTAAVLVDARESEIE